MHNVQQTYGLKYAQIIIWAYTYYTRISFSLNLPSKRSNHYVFSTKIEMINKLKMQALNTIASMFKLTLGLSSDTSILG